MKKYIFMLIAFFLYIVTILPISAMSNNDLDKPRIIVNGNYLKTDQQVYIDNDKIMVPLRAVFEFLGGQVVWTPSLPNCATVIIKDKTMVVALDSKNVEVNNEVIELNNKTILINNRILVSYDFIEKSINANVDWDGATKTVIIDAKNYIEDLSNFVVHFDLGKRSFPQSGEINKEFSINGGISVPKTYNNPVVFVLHGAHKIDDVDKTRNDLGYSYLLKELAKNGYIAISINVNSEYFFGGEIHQYNNREVNGWEPTPLENINKIFEFNLEYLKQANSGINVGYGIDLKGKADLTNINLIAHSASGGAVFDLVNRQQTSEFNKIRSIISIAPVFRHDKPIAPTVPTGVILPQYDGDVTGLDGEDILINTKNSKTPAQNVMVTYLYGANHNAFNEALLTDDFSGHSNAPRLSPEEQRNFLVSYSIDFLNSINGKNVESEIFLDKINSNNNIMYGKKVLNSFYNQGDKLIFHAGYDLLPKTYNANIKKVAYSPILPEHTAGAFRMPGNMTIDLLNIEWDKEDSFVKFPVLDINSDFSNYKFLSMLIAQDSSSEKNKRLNQSFTVKLEDKQGKTYEITLDNPSQLHWQEGEVENIDLGEWSYKTYTNFMPLGSLYIPLDHFKEIDFKEIISIEMKFNQNNSGLIMLFDISLSK